MACLFLYGTLKRGGANHLQMAGQRFLAEARTEPGYRLHLVADYPGMVPAAAGGVSIEGELWEVSPEVLARLDAFEGTSEGLYRRSPIRLLPPHDGVEAETYLYLRPTAGTPDLGSRFPTGAG